MEENGGTEHVTNLALEVLFKQKMEAKIKAQMAASGQTTQDGVDIPTLSTTATVSQGQNAT
jgi:hypothetical protein